jgi:hypothetical protein
VPSIDTVSEARVRWAMGRVMASSEFSGL